MKSKVVLRVLAATGILALFATAAQAGDGGRPSPLTSFFVCHSINGSSANKVVDLQSPVFGPDKVGVKIGNGTLACAWAKLFPPGDLPTQDNPQTLNEVVPNPGGGLDQLKCYTVSVARKTSGPVVFSVSDSLFGPTLPLVASAPDASFLVGSTETGINPSELRFICGPATYFR
jgi:hypothetical protein